MGGSETDKQMRINNIEVLDSRWFDQNFPNRCMGIIKARDTVTDELKFYIGCGRGVDPCLDTNLIVRHGTKYTRQTFAELLLNFFEFDELIKPPDDVC